MKITAENGLKIGKWGSTSPKTRFSGLFFDFPALQTLIFGKNESVEQGVPPYSAQGASRVNADVRLKGIFCI